VQRRMFHLGALALVATAACGSGGGAPADGAATPTDGPAALADGSAPRGPVYTCSSLPPLPWAFHLKEGPPPSEDFTFDREGYFLALSKNNLVRMRYDGAPQLVASNVATSGTGLRVLGNGDIAVGDEVRGTVALIDATGGQRVVGENIRGPNGIQIGPGGMLYVTDLSGGNLYRVDPQAGSTTLLGFVVDDADGLAFSPDYKTLFVNSYGSDQIVRVGLKPDGTIEAPVAWIRDLPAPDGMTVDECGNLYVAGYRDGILRRVSPDGKVEVVADFKVTSVSAVNFGSGKQGWDDRTIYVMNYTDGGVFEVQAGVRGAPPPP
jgi:hypothetical protein